MIPPTILTGRLILTAPTTAFFEQHLATTSDPRVAGRIGDGMPQSRPEAWRRYCQAAGLWSLVGYGFWAILDRATGAMIGFGRLADFERGLPALEGVPEAGWALNADWWGRGWRQSSSRRQCDGPTRHCLRPRSAASSPQTTTRRSLSGGGTASSTSVA